MTFLQDGLGNLGNDINEFHVEADLVAQLCGSCQKVERFYHLPEKPFARKLIDRVSLFA